jgi:hypothetical protein
LLYNQRQVMKKDPFHSGEWLQPVCQGARRVNFAETNDAFIRYHRDRRSGERRVGWKGLVNDN